MICSSEKQFDMKAAAVPWGRLKSTSQGLQINSISSEPLNSQHRQAREECNTPLLVTGGEGGETHYRPLDTQRHELSVRVSSIGWPLSVASTGRTNAPQCLPRNPCGPTPHVNTTVSGLTAIHPQRPPTCIAGRVVGGRSLKLRVPPPTEGRYARGLMSFRLSMG